MADLLKPFFTLYVERTKPAILLAAQLFLAGLLALAIPMSFCYLAYT
jgi:hypothetical protein